MRNPLGGVLQEQIWLSPQQRVMLGRHETIHASGTALQRENAYEREYFIA
jgi:hypothetical protein